MRAAFKSTTSVKNGLGRRGLRARALRGAALAAAAILAFAAVGFITPRRGCAQELGGKKLPGLSKIESKGATEAVFTGGVQMLNVRSKVLEVSTADGSTTAIFPISKKVRVSSIDGRKLKLAALTPGANVIVHYRQDGGRRTVQKIIIVSKAPASAKKRSSASREHNLTG